MILAAGKGDMLRVKSLLAKKADVNAKNKKGEMPLFIAAQKGRNDVAQLLPEKGGAKAAAFGVCTAYPKQGKHRARIARILYGGKVRGAFAMQLSSCRDCDFYNSPDYESGHRGNFVRFILGIVLQRGSPLNLAPLFRTKLRKIKAVLGPMIPFL